MKAVKCKNFNWERLVELIKSQNIIPILGPNIYSFNSKNKEKTQIYDFYAKQISFRYGLNARKDTQYNFMDVCNELKAKDIKEYNDLPEFLRNLTTRFKLENFDSIWKLLSIKNFKIFLTTVYDSLLYSITKNVREREPYTFSYTILEKKMGKFDKTFINSFNKSDSPLIYHLLGNFDDVDPAFTKKDILDTIISFNTDLLEYYNNEFFRILKKSCFLFLGFAYDSVMLKYFLPSFLNKIKIHSKESPKIFIGGISDCRNLNHISDLLGLLHGSSIEFIYQCDSKNFVDCLFDIIMKTAPNILIANDSFTKTRIPEIREPACLIDTNKENKEDTTPTSNPSQNNLTIESNIKKRLLILDQLDSLIEDQTTKEVEIHKILENNLWIFGAEYEFIASDKRLKNTIEKKFGQKYKGKGGKKRPDFILARKSDESIVVIEIKRPRHSVNLKDGFQAVKYRSELDKYLSSKISIFVLGGQISQGVRKEYETDNTKFMTYINLISVARNKIDLMLKPLMIK